MASSTRCANERVSGKSLRSTLGVVREKLRDSTVITIAHQLNTTLDCDKVLFLKHGEVAKFDKLDTSMNIEGSELGEMA